jgi:hypothetical protein
MRVFKPFLKGTEGAMAAEFAFVAPIFVLFVIGVFDYGMYINARMTLENKARVIAEYISLGGEIENADESALGEEATDLMDEEGDYEYEAEYMCQCEDAVPQECPAEAAAEEDVESEDLCPDSGDYMRRFIEVSLGRNYSPLFDYPGLPSSIHLQGQVRLQVN